MIELAANINPEQQTLLVFFCAAGSFISHNTTQKLIFKWGKAERSLKLSHLTPGNVDSLEIKCVSSHINKLGAKLCDLLSHYRKAQSTDKITKTRCCLIVNFIQQEPVTNQGAKIHITPDVWTRLGRLTAKISQTHLSLSQREREREGAYLQEAKSKSPTVRVGIALLALMSLRENTRDIKIFLRVLREHSLCEKHTHRLWSLHLRHAKVNLRGGDFSVSSMLGAAEEAD